MLDVVDEFVHDCLAIRVDRRLNSVDVIDVLSDLFILRGVPEHICSDNGPEFVAKAVQAWGQTVGARTAYVAPGSPWGEEDKVNDPVNRLPDERLHRELPQCRHDDASHCQNAGVRRVQRQRAVTGLK